MEDLKIGDYVICKSSGVIGHIINIYIPTACEKQVMVKTNDGRKYHAPYSDWSKNIIINTLIVNQDWGILSEKRNTYKMRKYGRNV